MRRENWGREQGTPRVGRPGRNGRRSLTQRTVAVPKPKPKGNEGVKVGGGDEHLGRVRVGEEPVPFLHGHLEGLDVREFRWETTREAGEREQKVGRAGRRRAPPKPKKEVGSRGREGRNTRGEAEKSRQGNWDI